MYYFAYASNLNLKQMNERCPGNKPLYKATLPNYKFVFEGWSRQLRGGKANIVLYKGEKVRGAVYDVSEQCLDRLESPYSRLRVTVYNEDDDPVEAITYINSARAEEAKPSEDYLKVIRQGYLDWRMVR